MEKDHSELDIMRHIQINHTEKINNKLGQRHIRLENQAEIRADSPRYPKSCGEMPRHTAKD